PAIQADFAGNVAMRSPHRLKIGLVLADIQIRLDSAVSVAARALKAPIGRVIAVRLTKGGSAEVAVALGNRG
ncbi:MAG: hypothetical protein FWB74_10500, partial [Defluviitaleaceae bacterium]|nr:hypothetical protein [Defluviitaleaceae bacterium]